MTTRKNFLAASAALAAVPQLAAAATPSPKPAPSDAPIPKLRFDLGAFDALLARDVAHKHLFADRKLDEGNGLFAVRNTLDAYKDLGIPASGVATAIVFYHGPSIFIAMDDHVWTTYLLPLVPKMRETSPELVKDFTSVVTAKTKGNPLLKTAAGDTYNASVEGLAADGLQFFVCNNALKGFAQMLAGHAKKPQAAVYSELSAHLVPHTTVVPAGVWAVHYGQEKRYTLLQTS